MNPIESSVKRLKLGQDEASYDARKKYYKKLRRQREGLALLRGVIIIMVIAVLIGFAILFFKK